MQPGCTNASRAMTNIPEGQECQGPGTMLQELAHHTTGPRTSAGKERSKRNALKHGIFSGVALLGDEPRAEFDSLLSGLRKDLAPAGSLEGALVEKLAILLWRYRRLLVAEAENLRRVDLVAAIKLNEVGSNMLDNADRLLRYEAGIERAFDRTLRQLERLQRMRLGQPVPPPIDVSVSLEQ